MAEDIKGREQERLPLPNGGIFNMFCALPQGLDNMEMSMAYNDLNVRLQGVAQVEASFIFEPGQPFSNPDPEDYRRFTVCFPETATLTDQMRALHVVTDFIDIYHHR